MKNVINMGPPHMGPQELICLKCSNNSFFVFPDSVITCTSCYFLMNIKTVGTLTLEALLDEE